MTYRSPFRDVADAFSNVAPNIAQGVANQAERKRQEDSWARAAAQKQTQDLQTRLGELRAQPPDQANKAETDQQIAMISRAMEMYQNVYTAQPGKAYDAWMSVSSGALSVPAVGPQAAASPRERAAGRPTTTGETMSVPELMGRSAGTVSKNLLTAEQRKLVQTSNSELVREAFKFLMNPEAIDFSNPLVEERVAQLLSSVDSLATLDVLPGMERMQQELGPLFRGLRTLIAKSETSERLRNLVIEKAENEVELQELNLQTAQVNLDLAKIQREFLPMLREREISLMDLDWATGNEQLAGMSFANIRQQNDVFYSTGFTGSPEQEARLMASMGIDANDPVQVAAFRRRRDDNFNAFKQRIEMEDQRTSLDLEVLRGTIDVNNLRAQELAASLTRGDFELERDIWTFSRDKELASVKDQVDALEYVFQASAQGDAGALGFILREMQNSNSVTGQRFSEVLTVEDVQRRYEYALVDENSRNKDRERRDMLTSLQFENAMMRTSNDALAAGIEVGSWAAQSMTKDDLAAWHAQQVSAGRTVPSLANLELERAAHMLTLQSPIKQELWGRIQEMSSMPNNPDTIATSIMAISELLTDPSLGLSPDVVDTYLNGFVEAQSRNWEGFNIERTASMLRNDLLEADIAVRHAEVQSRLAQAAAANSPDAVLASIFGDAIKGEQTSFDTWSALSDGVLDSISEVRAQAARLQCNAPTETRRTTGTAVPGSSLVLDSVQTTNVQPGNAPECNQLNARMIDLSAQYEVYNANAQSAAENADALRNALAANVGLNIPMSQSYIPRERPSAVYRPAFEYQDNPPAPSAPGAMPNVPAAATTTTPPPASATPAPAQPAPAQPTSPQGPMPNPNPTNQPAPTLSPQPRPTSVIPSGANVPAPRNPVVQQASDLARTLTGATEGPSFTSANGALSSFVFRGWHPSYRNPNASQYASPQLMAQAISAMANGAEKDRLADELHGYLRTYVQPSITPPTRPSAGSSQIASDILRSLGVAR